ncbi:MAG: NAD(P) transhydrogenase subunit alpha, partial [Alphaproteobacteria bacterium]|nr:NAD(P) transhydrogenase subunit alpha [Alphaproteobacteria bacterium]
MKIAIPKERRPQESRVAASPDTAKRLVGMGVEVALESGAGAGAAYPDAAYAAAGADIVPDAAAAMNGADIVLKVQRPIVEPGERSELALMKSGAVLIGMLQPLQHPDDVAAYAKAGITAFAMELIPRITRAQSMDVLSSQANLAGYRAVLDAAAEFGRAFPMMMTAAGTVAPARVLVMGAGVAGLQAIATARRLGAVVSATDVRAAAKEQVESLGASFLTVDLEAMKAAETAGGYAREMGEDFQRRQREMVTEALRRTDIVICTALIPGRRAPVLLTGEMVAGMAPGSVIIDLAVEAGGNVEGSQAGETVKTANGATI